MSRRGLFPLKHQAAQPYPCFLTLENSPESVRGWLHRVRAEVEIAAAQGYDWRAVIDSLRPMIQKIWQKLPTKEQQRFLRHLTPYWDVHRHRIAPRVADVVTQMLDSAQLTIAAGRIREYQSLVDGVAVTVCQRKTQTNNILHVSRVVNCTGVAADYRRSPHPLITNLRSQKLIRPNAIGLGLYTDTHGALYATDDNVSTLLYTLGTPRKGDLWESIAVPELRGQAQELSKALLQSLPARVRTIATMPLLSVSDGVPPSVADVYDRLRLRSAEIPQSTFLFRQFFDPETRACHQFNVSSTAIGR